MAFWLQTAFGGAAPRSTLSEKKALGHLRSSFFRVVWEGRTQERKPVEFGPLLKSQVSSEF